MKVLLYPLQLIAVVFGIFNILPSFTHPEHAAAVLFSFMAAYFLAEADRDFARTENEGRPGFLYATFGVIIGLTGLIAGPLFLLTMNEFTLTPFLGRFVAFGPGGLALLVGLTLIVRIAGTKDANWFYINLPPLLRLEKIYCRCGCDCGCGMCDGGHKLEVDQGHPDAIWFDHNFLGVLLVGPWCSLCWIGHEHYLKQIRENEQLEAYRRRGYKPF